MTQPMHTRPKLNQISPEAGVLLLIVTTVILVYGFYQSFLTRPVTGEFSLIPSSLSALGIEENTAPFLLLGICAIFNKPTFNSIQKNFLNISRRTPLFLSNTTSEIKFTIPTFISKRAQTCTYTDTDLTMHNQAFSFFSPIDKFFFKFLSRKGLKLRSLWGELVKPYKLPTYLNYLLIEIRSASDPKIWTSYDPLIKKAIEDLNFATLITELTTRKSDLITDLYIFFRTMNELFSSLSKKNDEPIFSSRITETAHYLNHLLKKHAKIFFPQDANPGDPKAFTPETPFIIMKRNDNFIVQCIATYNAKKYASPHPICEHIFSERLPMLATRGRNQTAIHTHIQNRRPRFRLRRVLTPFLLLKLTGNTV
jgi:hypothetical protein